MMKLLAVTLAFAAALWTVVDVARFADPYRFVPALEARHRAERQAAATETERARLALAHAAALSVLIPPEKLRHLQEAKPAGWSFAFVFALLGILFWFRPEDWISVLFALAGLGYAIGLFVHLAYIPLPAFFQRSSSARLPRLSFSVPPWTAKGHNSGGRGRSFVRYRNR